MRKVSRTFRIQSRRRKAITYPAAGLALTVLCLGSPALAIPFISNDGQVQTRVTTNGATGSDSQSVTSPQDADLFVRTVQSLSPGLNAADIDSTISEPDESRIAYRSLSRVRLSRLTTDPFASGAADLEPSQFFTFAVPTEMLRLDLSAVGSIDITNEIEANNSTARFDVLVRNLTTDETLFRDSRRSPTGYSVTQIVDFDVTPGDVLGVSIDNSTSGFIGGQETDAEITSQLNLTFIAIPEPAAMCLVGFGGLLLSARRPRPAHGLSR